MIPPPHSPLPSPAPAAAPTGAESADAFLLRYLDANDVPCPACGYNLRALTQPRCPECGRPVHLKVALRVPPMRAWIVMATATCTGAGLGVIFAAFERTNFYLTHTRPAIVFFYACVPLAAFVVLARRRITRWSPAVQSALATTLAVLTGLAMLYFVARMD